mgnify:CR=1 FL=1
MRGKSISVHTAAVWVFFLFVTGMTAAGFYRAGWQGFVLGWLLGSIAMVVLYPGYTTTMYPNYRAKVPWNRLLWGIVLSAGLGPCSMLGFHYGKLYQRLGFDPSPYHERKKGLE